MYPKLDYDIERDFIPLALLANVPQVLVVNPRNVPFTAFPAFLDHVRRNPAKLNYASAGSGTSHHLAGELFKLQSNTFITHIPYRGAGPALQDLIGGNVDMMFDGLGSSAAHIKGGRIRALMVSGKQRNPAFPDVPCAAEVGLPDYTVTTWYGLWAPRGTAGGPAGAHRGRGATHRCGRRDQGRMGQERCGLWRAHAGAVRRDGGGGGEALGAGGEGFGGQIGVNPPEALRAFPPFSRAARGRGDDAGGPVEPVPRRLLALACSAAIGSERCGGFKRQ